MALINCDFFAESLSLSTSMTVIIPQQTRSQIGMTGSAAGPAGAPVLYLLHGLSDDHTIWLRRTSIERYVAPLGLAVVMPAVNRSFYADEVHGNAYWTFLSEELPELVAEFFHVSRRRADTFVAGLSMGGTGRSSGRCPSPNGSPPRPACPARWTSWRWPSVTKGAIPCSATSSVAHPAPATTCSRCCARPPRVSCRRCT